MYEKLTASARFIQENKTINPKLGIVLASGLDLFLEQIENAVAIPYEEIPYFKISSNSEQKNRLILGKIKGNDVVILCGRIHLHEGFSIDDVVFPTRVMATLGIRDLIITNSAGGISENYNLGDLVLIKDHINLMGPNPLVGAEIIELGNRFPDMAQVYHRNIQELFLQSAQENSIALHQGVYCAVTGPIYETAAEVKMLKILGADLVGMSSVPEAIAALHLGLRVASISCITKMATGLISKNQDKIEGLENTTEKFSRLLTTTIPKILES